MVEIVSVTSVVETVLEPGVVVKDEKETNASLLTTEYGVTSEVINASTDINSSIEDVNHLNESTPFETTSVTEPTYPIANKQNMVSETIENMTIFESPPFSGSFSSAGIPAPSAVSKPLQITPGKVLVPAVVDQTQGQALSALQVLKVCLSSFGQNTSFVNSVVCITSFYSGY